MAKNKGGHGRGAIEAGKTPQPTPVSKAEKIAAIRISEGLHIRELPVANINNRKSLRPLALVLGKLAQTKERLAENGLAIENEIKSDIPTYVETLVALVTFRPLTHVFSLVASTCALTITYLFYLKRQALMDEYLETYKILETYKELRDQGDEDEAWMYLGDAVHNSGLLFEDVAQALRTKDFPYAEHKAYANELISLVDQRGFAGRMEQVRQYMQKPPKEHLAIINTILVQTPGFVKRTARDVVHNFQHIPQTLKAAKDGLKMASQVARDFEIRTDRPKEKIRLASPHPAVLDPQFNIAASGLSDDVHQIVIQSRANLLSKEARTRDLKLLAVNHALNCLYTVSNFAQMGKNILQADPSTIASLALSVAAVANNVLAINLVSQPLRNSSEEIKHGRAVVDSIRARLADLYGSLSVSMQEKPQPDKLPESHL